VNISYATVPDGHVGDFYGAVAGLFPSSVKVYVGSVPDTPKYPYAVLWGSLGDETSEALADVPDEIRIPFRVTYVGLTLAQVAHVASKVRPALNRAAPYVSNWITSRMRQSSLMDIQTDRDVTITGSGAHPLYAVDEFLLVASKLRKEAQ
jgi:hypothetical protein